MSTADDFQSEYEFTFRLTPEGKKNPIDFTLTLRGVMEEITEDVVDEEGNVERVTVSPASLLVELKVARKQFMFRMPPADGRDLFKTGTGFCWDLLRMARMSVR